MNNGKPEPRDPYNGQTPGISRGLQMWVLTAAAIMIAVVVLLVIYL